MFSKKPRRNFRQRRASSGDEEAQRKDAGDGEEDQQTAVVVNKLSKSAQGRGISCSSKREATPPKADNSDEEDGEALEVTGRRHEKKNDKDEATRTANTILSFSDDKEAEEPSFKLKKPSDKAVLFQARKKEASPVTKTLRAAGGGVPPSGSPRQDYGDDDDDDDDDDVVGSDDDGDSDGSSVSSLSASSASDSSHSAAQPVVIPNSREIEAARRQRRATRARKEFIPLSGGGRSSAGSTPDHYSRSNEDERVDDDEDDDDDEELDDHERVIEFAPRLKSIRERIAEKLGDDSLSGTDGEEQELWEETQIGKGVRRRPGEQSPSGSECSSSSSIRRDGQRRKKGSAGRRIPKTLPPTSVSLVKKRIMGKLDSLKEVHRARQAELRRMEGDVESAQTSVETLEESSSERQLKFFRAMILYVHNLVECLQEKVIEINSLELELHTLLSDHAEALSLRRRHEIKEQAERLQQLSYGSGDPAGGSSNGKENQGEAEEDSRDIPADTRASAEEEEQLQRKMADVLLRAQTVFADVQDDFHDVRKILSRFEEWRASYSDSYHSAYISLCLPKLLGPFLRLQLLPWSPLKDASGDFEKLPWFTALETFCHGHGHEELDHTDRQTLSNVIERTILPKITCNSRAHTRLETNSPPTFLTCSVIMCLSLAYAELVWDPLSRRQSVCLSDVCHRLNEDYSVFKGEQSKQAKAFTDTVLRRLRSCVDEDVFIPLYPKKFLDDRSSPQSRFREQQFWTAVKLLGNMGKWDSLLPESGLKELMLDKLLNRYLMITLCSHAQSANTVGACKKIADSLPLSWFSSSFPQLQNFRNYLVEKIHTLCKQHPPEDPNTRSAVTEVLQILSRIRCHDSIMTIAEKYHYEDVVYSHQLLNQDTE